MGRTIFGTNSRKQALNRSIRGRKAICESLEDRKLMSLTVEVRGTDGSTSVGVTAVGQVVNLELIAVVTDPNNTPSQDGLQDVVGSISSVASQGHAVAGNLVDANFGHFDANGAQPGTSQDINGDGNIDIGSPDPGNTVDPFIARSSPLQTSIDGTIVGNTLTYEIATLTYTVTNLNKGGATSINFIPNVSDEPSTGAWLEDDNAVSNVTGTFQAGTAYKVNDAALIVPPVAEDDSATVTKNTPLDINELANDDIIVALNPSSVVIVTNAAHGTTALQADGSVLYTPTTDYLGPDSFTYHVADTDGRVSNTATVNITVKLAPPPVAVAVSATTLRNQAVSVNVASVDTSAMGTIVPGTVAVVTAPTSGTAVAQSDGTILYTPHTGFTGTDTFTYTVGDSNQETSNPGTVTVSVTLPVPPVANPDSFTTSEGAPINLNVLANDISQSAALAPSTVIVTSDVQHGTTSVGSNGSVLYTPTPGFMGTDSFTYTVADVLGDTSGPAVVSLIIGADIAPVATTTTAYALAGSATMINISSVVSSGAPLAPSTAAVVTEPADGILSESNGVFTYTPNTGFVGSDSFTFNVEDVNGDATSTPGTVDLFVGAAVASKGSAAHSITFIDAGGGSQTVSINSGTANVYFSGTGKLATAKNGSDTISGQSNLQIANILLNNTSKSSTLSIKGVVAHPVTISGITDESAMGTISAASAVLTGAELFDGGLASIKVASITGAQITVLSGSTGKLAVAAGAVTDSGLKSAVPITSLKVSSWTDGSAQTISAPSIASLIVAGAFDPSLTLSGKGVDLVSAKITGAVSGGTWAIAGAAGSISLGSAASAWAPTILGGVNSLAIKAGGLASALVAETIGTLTIGGDLTAGITTASAKLIKVTGGASGSALTFTGAAGLKALSIGGVVSNETISSAGSIGAVTVGSFSGSTLIAGVGSGVTVANATAATLGTDVIGSVKVTSKATGAFAGTSILASKITSATLGSLTTDNSGTPFGLATKSIGSFSATFANGPVHLGAAQLKSETILQLYVSQQAIIFSDFSLAIES